MTNTESHMYLLRFRNLLLESETKIHITDNFPVQRRHQLHFRFTTKRRTAAIVMSVNCEPNNRETYTYQNNDPIAHD